MLQVHNLGRMIIGMLASAVFGALVSWGIQSSNSTEKRLVARTNRALQSRALVPESKLYQINFVVLGTVRSFSGPDKDFLRSIRLAQGAVRALASEVGAVSSVVGVALDRTPDAGLQWLSTIGGFDEVATGQGWVGNSAVHYIWSDTSYRASLPQIRVELRTLSIQRERIRETKRQMLLSLVGKDKFPDAQAQILALRDSVQSLLSGKLVPSAVGGTK